MDTDKPKSVPRRFYGDQYPHEVVEAFWKANNISDITDKPAWWYKSHLFTFHQGWQAMKNLISPEEKATEKGRQLTMEESVWYICPRCGADRWMLDKDSLLSRENPTLLGCVKCGFIKVA